MSEYVPEGALLPSGINVDETAAYFGITDSSKILVEMENVNRHTSLTMVLNKVSDLLLTDTFDLDSGSNRLQVETGEIYYILTGPLKLIEITENLQDFLGLNPEGNSEKPNISDEEFAVLESFLDPLNILKIYAIGDVTGGNNELAKYVTAFDNMIKNPSENVQNLIQIKKEMTEILIETKNMQMPRPISILKSSKSVNTPKLITPQITVETKVQEPIIENIDSEENIEKEVFIQPKLQQPTALKPPSNQSKVIEPTPLAKPERLQRPEIISKKDPAPMPEKTTMEDLEKNSTDTTQWVQNKPIQNETVAPKIETETKPIETKIQPVITPVAPKAKPIETKIQPAITPVAPKANPPVNTQNLYENKTPNTLPTPKQRSLPKPIINSNSNGIIRTFPSGNICNGCGVSLNNSWRFCPLCGFNN
ncbi:MAG: hypothetical protein VX613_00305 [Candidatus Thermoplasmatota archaeon]|nr:hypothetical protein [Candidatus Thermoplasmatota archaeon]MEE3135065.1 hypothetical protein [Candidatus Thermoplasmatota archaeon]